MSSTAISPSLGTTTSSSSSGGDSDAAAIGGGIGGGIAALLVLGAVGFFVAKSRADGTALSAPQTRHSSIGDATDTEYDDSFTSTEEDDEVYSYNSDSYIYANLFFSFHFFSLKVILFIYFSIDDPW